MSTILSLANNVALGMDTNKHLLNEAFLWSVFMYIQAIILFPDIQVSLVVPLCHGQARGCQVEQTMP